MALKRHLQQPEELAPRQIRVLAGVWDVAEGNHPSLARQLPELAAVPLFPTDEVLGALPALGLPVGAVKHGHHVMRDHTFQFVAASEADEWPFAPVFVRDLCGRVVHTGLAPLSAPPSVPLFPTGCADVTAEVAGADLIENAAFFALRRVECTPPSTVPLAGQPDDYVLQAAIAGVHHIPYKLRVDTFYADGWRLPQLARVFARPVPPVEAQKAGESFMQRWQQRPEGQGYEAFYEANDGVVWFESLFLQGCTVIPTFEACNGRYHVDDTYHPTEVDPGRAVPGLHTVVEARPSPLPQGTILDVLEPGWAMQSMLHPAKVVVSDGSGFAPAEAPLPLLPDLRLPHPRVSGTWGAVWLPTHPQHFAEPALWDWNETGHFVQISGPLWDPLHYTYTSTPRLLRALRRPVEGNPHLYQLPPVLKEQFHPACPQTWLDVINERTAQQRAEDVHHPLHTSAIDSVLYNTPVAPIGYHPLPVALSYELDPAIFPALNPCHQTRPCPPEYANRLVSTAICLLPEDEVEKQNVVLSEGLRTALARAKEQPESTYAATGPVWLPHCPASVLLVNVKRHFAQRAYRQALQHMGETLGAPTLATSFYRFREAALAWRRLRYRLFTKYAGVWHKAWQRGLDLQTAETLVLQGDDTSAAAVQLARRGVVGVSPVPVEEAMHLPSRARKDKLTRERAL